MKRHGKAWLVALLSLLISVKVCVLPSLGAIRPPENLELLSEWDTLQTARLVAARGFRATRFISFWNTNLPGKKFVAYTHYPPLTFWLYSAAGKAFGWRYTFQFRSLNVALAASFLVTLPLVAQAIYGQAWIGFASVLFVLNFNFWRNLFGATNIFAVPFAVGPLLYLCYWKAVRSPLRLSAAWIGLFVLNFSLCLSQFDYWLFLPTAICAHLLLGLRVRECRLSWRHFGWLLAVAVSGVALTVALRLLINYGYYGSWRLVLGDLVQAAQVRAMDCTSSFGQMTAENQINYEGSRPCGEGFLGTLWRTNLENLRRWYPFFIDYFGNTFLVLPAVLGLLAFRKLSGARDPRPGLWVGLCFFVAAIPFCVLMPAIYRQGFANAPFYLGWIVLFWAGLDAVWSPLAARLPKPGLFEGALALGALVWIGLLPMPRMSLGTGIQPNPEERAFHDALKARCRSLPGASPIVWTTRDPHWLNFICAEDAAQFVQITPHELCAKVGRAGKGLIILSDARCAGGEIVGLGLRWRSY